jgi:hypothetical protein
MKNTHSTDVERRGGNDDNDAAAVELVDVETAEGACAAADHTWIHHTRLIYASGRVFFSLKRVVRAI